MSHIWGLSLAAILVRGAQYRWKSYQSLRGQGRCGRFLAEGDVTPREERESTFLLSMNDETRASAFCPATLSYLYRIQTDADILIYREQ